MKVTIYHNPRCSKSRQTLQILQDHNLEIEAIEYLKTPPDKHTLTALLNMLGMEPRDLMRKKEKAYKEAGMDNPQLDYDALIEGMIANPILIERPIVVINNKAVIGRPPEAVESLL